MNNIKYLKIGILFLFLNLVAILVVFSLPTAGSDVVGSSTLYGYYGSLALRTQLLLLLQLPILGLIGIFLKFKASKIEVSNKTKVNRANFFIVLPILHLVLTLFYRWFYAGISLTPIVIRLILVLIFIFLILEFAGRILKLNATDAVVFVTIILTTISLAMRYFRDGTRVTYFVLALGSFVAFCLLYAVKKFQSSQIANRFKDSLILIGFNFLVHSQPQGKINLHPFESFGLANVKISETGGIPWRDFSVEHGVWEDYFRYKVSALIGGTDAFGMLHGYSTVVRPIELSVLSICIYSIVGNLNLTLAINTFYILISPIIGFQIDYPRMIPLLVLSVVLRGVLVDKYKEKSSNSIRILGALSGFFLLWTNEAIYGVFAVLIVLAVSDLPIRSLVNLRQSLVAQFALFSTLTFLSLLVPTGLFKYWIERFLSDSDGYFFAWGAGLKPELGASYLLFLLVTPLALLYLLFVSAVLLHRTKKEKLFIFPLIVTSFFYFIKFVQWPDWHLHVPVTILSWALILGGAWYLRQRLSQIQIKVVALTLLVVLAIGQIVKVDGLVRPALDQLGTRTSEETYSSETLNYANRIKHVSEKFGLDKDNNGVRVFDFGNEPVGWYLLAARNPVGDGSKVLNYYTAQSQRRIVSELEKNKSAYVIWGGERGYWSWPFNGTWMRQYIISQYLLENYTPTNHDGGYVLLRRNGVVQEQDENALSGMRSLNCFWHQAIGKFRIPNQPNLGEDVKIDQTKGELRYFEIGNVPTAITNPMRNGFFIHSNRTAMLTLKSSGSNGLISFQVPGGSNWTPVWLAGCPTWKLQNTGERWSIEMSDPSLEIRIKFMS